MKRNLNGIRITMVITLLFVSCFLIGTSLAQNTFPSQGRVGINTTNPSHNLVVVGPESEPTNNGMRATMKIRNGQNQLFFDGDEIDTDAENLFLNNNTDANVILGMGGGKVGIGTAAPNANLHVEGLLRAGDIRGTQLTSTGNINGQTLRITNKLVLGEVDAGGGGFDHQWEIGLSTSNDLTWGLRGIGGIGGSPFSEKFRISNEGNVGINVNDPVDKLSVFNTGDGRTGFFQTDNATNRVAAVSAITNGMGNALFANILNQSSTAPALFASTSGRGPAARFDRGDVNVLNGNLGIGTRDPLTKLHVQGNNDGTDVLVRDRQFARMHMVATAPEKDVTLVVQARGDNAVNRAETGTLSKHDLVLFTDQKTRINIGADGSVCIGKC